ncbi:MAG TPA: outer membrane beta-barrel protein [Planctomycetota bacterium]|nr:outer membrane beta-barrel protein [Planctomycetota bacterium]
MRTCLSILVISIVPSLASAQTDRDVRTRDETTTRSTTTPRYDERRADEDYLEPYNWEFSLSALGSWSKQDGSDAETITFGGEAALGFFLTEWFEPGVKVEYQHQETDFGGTETEINALLAAGTLTLNLPTRSAFVPFITGSGGIVYADFETETAGVVLDTDDTGVFWEAGGGFRIFVSRWASLNFKVTFQQFIFDDEGDVNNIAGTAGIAIHF